MAAITLTQVWINDGRDLGDYIKCFTEEAGFDEDDSANVEVRSYASGRTRSVSRAGTRRSISGTLVELRLRDVEWLREHRGKLIVFRDWTGRKMWGTYPTIRPKNMQNTVEYFTVNLTLTEVTYVEGVV